MPLTSAQQAALSAAIDRLQNYYDGDNPYNPSTNPGGFRQGGQVVNFEPALKDTATVMNLASILVSDATAAATNSPKAVRVDSALSFTEIERGQGRANIVAAPKSVSTSGNFSASDIGAPIRTSGTITRTLPSAGLVPAGWATGVVENAGSGVVTIAPANGEVLEGVVNNTIKLLSKQRAYFYLDTDGWHIGWVDRCPIIASKAISTPASSIDLPMPVSYGAFELSITGLRVSAVGNLVGIFSTDSGGTFLSRCQRLHQHDRFRLIDRWIRYGSISSRGGPECWTWCHTCSW